MTFVDFETSTFTTGNDSAASFTTTKTFNGGLYMISYTRDSTGTALSTNASLLVAGSPSTVATSATTFGSAAVVAVAMSGGNIAVWVNGTPLLAATDSFNVSATKHGLLRQQTVNNSRHDNFTVTTP